MTDRQTVEAYTIGAMVLVALVGSIAYSVEWVRSWFGA